MPNPARERTQLVQLQAELLQLESHIRTVRESLQTAIAQPSESSQPSRLTSDESTLMTRIAESVVSRLAARPEAQRLRKQHVREKEAAEYLGVKVATLRAWRMYRSKNGPPVIRLGRMVLYPMAELEQHMRERLIPQRR